MWIILVFLIICAIWFLYKVAEAKAEKAKKRSFDNMGEKSTFSEEKKAMEKKVFEEVYKPFIDKTLTSVPMKSAFGEAAIKKFLNEYIAEHSIDDKSGLLRNKIYTIYREKRWSDNFFKKNKI